jgi:hypothetical protein
MHLLKSKQDRTEIILRGAEGRNIYMEISYQSYRVRLISNQNRGGYYIRQNTIRLYKPTAYSIRDVQAPRQALVPEALFRNFYSFTSLPFI